VDEITKLLGKVARLETELKNEREGRQKDRQAWQHKGALRELREAFVRAGCSPQAATDAAHSVLKEHAEARKEGGVRKADLQLGEDGAVLARSWLLDGYHDSADSLAARFLAHAPFFRGEAAPQGGGTLRELAASALHDAVKATGAGLRPLVHEGPVPADGASLRDAARTEFGRALGEQ